MQAVRLYPANVQESAWRCSTAAGPPAETQVTMNSMSTLASDRAHASLSSCMAALTLFLIIPPATAKDTSVDLATMAGTYRKSLKLYDSAGNSYVAEDILQIFQCGKDRAYIYTVLNFVNYHECSLGGFAVSEEGALVYHPAADEGTSCALRIIPKAGRIIFEDPEQKCSYYCGARGHFDAGDFRVSTRRKITDSDRRRIVRDIDDDFEKCR